MVVKNKYVLIINELTRLLPRFAVLSLLKVKGPFKGKRVKK